MKKTRIKERFENAVEAFFDNDKLPEDKTLSFAGERALFNDNSSPSESKKCETYLSLFKQALLFFPGAFLLFNLSLRLTVFTLNPTDGVKFFNPLLLIICSLLIVAGIGSLKNIRHIAIPLAIISFSVVLGGLSELIGDGLNFYYNYGVYFVPLALIIPVLAKDWIDSKCEDMN